ncbi:MAG: hypothetical protein N2C14_31725 [Planctomycetales bacterium]
MTVLACLCPENIAPLASILATAGGMAIIFWDRILALFRRGDSSE